MASAGKLTGLQVLLRQLPIAAMAAALGRTGDSARALERYRDELVEQVLAQAVPE